MTVYLASGKNCSEQHKVRNIIVDPSAVSWVTVIQNSAGTTLFSARGSDAVTRSYPVDIDSTEFNQATATNITAIMLVCD